MTCQHRRILRALRNGVRMHLPDMPLVRLSIFRSARNGEEGECDGSSTELRPHVPPEPFVTRGCVARWGQFKAQPKQSGRSCSTFIFLR